MDTPCPAKIHRYPITPNVDFNHIMQSPIDSDFYLKRTKDFMIPEINSKGKDSIYAMAHPRCVPQLVSMTFRRMFGLKLFLLSVVSTLIVFSLHEFVLPKYVFLFKFAAFDRANNSNLWFTGVRQKNKSIPRGRKKAPGCIIFGVSKCGTRAILEYLKLHPNVVAASTEIDFFNNDTLYARGPSWYLEQMPLSRDGQIAVEKSPDYFQNPKCASRISQFSSQMKMLLLLRDPVERLISQYMQLLDKNPKLPPFEEWAIHPKTGLVNANVPSVRVSAYAEHFDKWLDAFPKNQILIIESRSLRINPFQEMKRVERFLNIKHYFQQSDFYFNSTRGFYCVRYRSSGKTKCLGKSKGRQHIPVDSKVIEQLQNYYKPYNKQLNDMVGFRFEWS